MLQARVSEILELLYKGEATDEHREEMITGFLPLADGVAATIGHRYGKDAADLQNEAELELVIRIDKVWKGEKRLHTDELGKYLTRSIAHRCRAAITKTRTVHMVSRTIRYRLAEGLNPEGHLSPQLIKADLPIYKKLAIRKLPVVYQDSVINDAKTLEGKALDNFIKNKIYELLPIPKVSIALEDYPDEDERPNIPFGVPQAKRDIGMDMRELLHKAARGPIERKILAMREEGYTYQEIAPAVGMNFNSVCRRVNEMEERYDYFSSL